MFVRDGLWEKVPVSSKLWKMARVANPDLENGQEITKKMFTGKMYECKLKKSGVGPAAYTVVDSLIRKLAG